jgi:tRNA(fMet)-specific endonuclease VapC
MRQVARFQAQSLASTVLPLTDEVVVRAADVYAGLHRSGQLIGDADTLIAATALVAGLSLVTNNLAHYRRVPGLRVTSWRGGAEAESLASRT